MSNWQQFEIQLKTSGRGAIDITERIARCISDCDIETGLAHVFLKHTSASLMLCENADGTVLLDMETILARLAPDADPQYRHDYEGDDDMAAHVRSVLTANDISVPISAGKLNLGTWQGLFLYEHRYRAHSRNLVITISGQ